MLNYQNADVDHSVHIPVMIATVPFQGDVEVPFYLWAISGYLSTRRARDALTTDISAIRDP